jgi:TfoX/Sxy family transcriptional regulator of competence genes
MASSEIEQLEELLNSATTKLKNIESKKMFGCHAAWIKGNVFALVWKKGRLAVKLPDETTFNKLMGEKGAAPWKIGPKTMGHWVFVPKTFHKNARSINTWVKKASELCADVKNTKKKKVSKKVIKKKIVKRKSAKKTGKNKK